MCFFVLKNVLKIQGIHTDRETGHPTLKKGKLNLVDLAGSERHGKTGISTNSGDAFTESKVCRAEEDELLCLLHSV